ncbi:hypothetical protein LJR027_001306 [Terrabacter sp. LjRoot27]|uniref:hypothetical protein n=1 Tax=Terrabacter sp. LjRoot27 TaxID=3342306 RepID=UPI003ECE0F7A
MTEGSRVAGAADPATLRALAAGRSTTRALSDDLLTHLPDLGDLPTQRALDTWVEQAADTLRALSEALEERLLDLGAPGRPHEGADDRTSGAAGPPTQAGDAR